MIKDSVIPGRSRQHGQSFVELMLVVLILALMVSGVVEFGYLLNSYLKVLDGTREGARYSNMDVAFVYDDTPPTPGYVSVQSFYVNTAIQAMRVMSPIVLNGNRGDDIVISVFTISGSSIVRWPLGYAFGWNLCDNRLDPVVQSETNIFQIANWNTCTPKRSHFTDAQIQALMDASAPASGVLLVEAYYNYPQILKLPVFAQVIPDPIPVYTYSVMPLTSAEPTPTPIP
jgi:hypothetical protein